MSDAHLQFAHFTWFYIVYGGLLFYLLTHKSRVAKPGFIYLAAGAFGAVALLELPHMLIAQVLLWTDAGRAAWLTVWMRGLSWSLIGISMLSVVWSVMPKGKLSQVKQMIREEDGSAPEVGVGKQG